MKKTFWSIIISFLPTLLFANEDSISAQNLDANKNIFVDSIYVNEKLRIDNTSTLYLGAQDDDVLFFITGCNPADSVSYQWKGLDKKPLLCRSSVIRYINIEGGDYAFVLGKIKNGVFLQSIILPIKVKYTIPEHPLFVPSLLFSLLFVFGSIVYLWLIYNFRQQMKVQSLRNQIVADLHDEVGSTLSSIAIMSKVLRKNLTTKDPSSLPVLDKILSTSKETILNLRDTVWAINPDNDSFEKLLEKMRSFAYEMLVNEDIKLNYQNNLNKDKVLKISMEQRRNVYLMFKECVHNIVKHSSATNVEIIIKNHDEGFSIHINDNGKGFDKNQNSDGNGMKTLEKRAKDCFIDLDIKSQIDKGTNINMIVPEL